MLEKKENNKEKPFVNGSGGFLAKWKSRFERAVDGELTARYTMQKHNDQDRNRRRSPEAHTTNVIQATNEAPEDRPWSDQ